MVFDKIFVLSVFSIFSLFVAVLYKLNEFLLVYCACSHVASAISAMLASMCEYWSCALQSKLSRPPKISWCRAFTWIIVVPVNRVTRVVQEPVHMDVRYLGPPRYLTFTRQLCPRFTWKLSGLLHPEAIRTRHNNTRENCILNVHDGVQQKPCFISFLYTFSFCCCSISIK